MHAALQCLHVIIITIKLASILITRIAKEKLDGLRQLGRSKPCLLSSETVLIVEDVNVII